MYDIAALFSFLTDKLFWLNVAVLLGFYSIYEASTWLYQKRIGGSFKKQIRVFNKSKLRKFYKQRRIAKYIFYLAMCVPQIIWKNNLYGTLPFCLGIGLSIINIIQEKEIEIAFEYENGIKYRGKMYRWSKVKNLGEMDDYSEMELNEKVQLIVYKDKKNEEEKAS
jgi:hypothetical protein